MTTCEEIADRETIEKYAAGRLGEAEAAAFEEHYLTCAHCQEELRFAAAVRTAAARPERARRPWRIYAGGAALLAAGLAALLFWPDARRAELERLGGVAVPPVYLGVQVRAGAATADSIFRTAMDDYVAGRYENAAAALRDGLDAGVEPASGEFFLGASLLQLGRNEEAAAAFARAIAAGDTPYRAEAAYYRAKALLRTGDAESALRELERAVSDPGVIGQQAGALVDSIRAVD